MILAMVVNDEGSNNLEDTAKKALTRLGSRELTRLGFRYALSCSLSWLLPPPPTPPSPPPHPPPPLVKHERKTTLIDQADDPPKKISRAGLGRQCKITLSFSELDLFPAERWPSPPPPPLKPDLLPEYRFAFGRPNPALFA